MTCTNRCTALEPFVNPHVDCVSAIFVTQGGDRQVLLHLILHLHRLVLRVRYIGAECQQDIPGDPLLNRNLCAWIRLAVAR